MDKVKLFKDLVVGDVIYLFKLYNDNSPADIHKATVKNIKDYDEEIMTVDAEVDYGKNKCMYYMDLESEASIDITIPYDDEIYVATSEEEIQKKRYECLKDAIDYHKNTMIKLTEKLNNEYAEKV